MDMPQHMDTHDVYKEKIKLCLFINMVGILPTKRLTFEVLMIQYLVCFRLGKDVMRFVASWMWKMMKVQNKKHTLILFEGHSKIKQMHYGRRRRFSVTKTILSFCPFGIYLTRGLDNIVVIKNIPPFFELQYI